MSRGRHGSIEFSEENRHPLRYSWAHEHQVSELGYEHDWDDLDAPDREALRRDMLWEEVAVALEQLDDLERAAVTEHVINQGYTLTPRPRSNYGGFRATRDAIGPNPSTGNPYCDKRVKRAVLRGLAKLRAHFEGLDPWKKTLLGIPSEHTPAPRVSTGFLTQLFTDKESA